MTLLAQAKNDITVEETAYRSSISEATMQRIGSSINWINANAGTHLGDIISSALTLSQFQALRGTQWVLMDGADITGTDFANLTGITTLPNMVANEAFLGQRNAQAIGAYEANQNQSHSHTTSMQLYESSGGSARASGTDSPTGGGTAAGSTNNSGGTVARPNTYRVNFFIKVNDTPL